MKKCKDCNKEGCPYRAYTENAECLYAPCREIEEKTLFDWQSFRAEAAKDILCALLDNGYSGDGDNPSFVMQAIGIADELVKQLKEKEEK